ncbi:hypothetical protein BDV36DRAFT_298567 [Aspergillus pseudocaelatus]|uniref:CFEM domain-containing protein n=1 Tax=Aspergillus pseudocaelatus TaxID=1825620 RepID=A0ABQ6WCT9_9EURO|nr:hypothetical protein BDV36DRAFT_298567 [Aspergillus pseudocaelatus]
MKLYYISVILMTCLSTVIAQGMDGLPDCAKDCATGSIPKQCQTIDVACICGDKSFINSISCCVANKCSKDQQDAVLKFASQLCSGAGVNDLPKSASCAEGSSSATETSSDSSASSKSTTAKSTATNESATTTGSSGSSASPIASKSGSNTKTSSTSSPTTSTGGAALVQGKDTSLLAAIGAAVFAFLA